MIRFTREDRSTFPYWFAHWCAYNMTALNLKAWKFKYLFHDFEKPWIKLFVNYETVQKFHRVHNSHHIVHYFLTGKIDPDALVIDWECCRFTKQQAQLNAFNTFKSEMFQLYYTDDTNSTIKILRKKGYLFDEKYYEKLSRLSQLIFDSLDKFELIENTEN